MVRSVSQINQYIKSMFDGEYTLRQLYVKGEVSNCKYHTSGHIYFTLKDRTSQISCVMFRGNRSGLQFPMKDGQSVVVFGSIQVYERDGKYQLYASRITADGAGDLYEQYEKLKRKLHEEGLFDEAHKKPIPAYAGKVGVVTADTGAAIQDICNISARRNPYVQLYLYPVKVQGEQAEASIIEGIRYFDKTDVDVVIIGRGGGSIEDLWAFNGEALAHAIYQAKKPIISAVGHETDTTIADFVADMRAPTPSAAAELAVYPVQAVTEALKGYQEELDYALRQRLKEFRGQVERYRLILESRSPAANLASNRQYAAELCNRLEQAMQSILTEKKHQLRIYAEKLKGLSPLDKIASGYAYVEGKDGKGIKSVTQVKEKDNLHLILADGMIETTVTNIQLERLG